MPQVIFGMKKTLFHRNRLAVEFFDFVLGWGGCGGSGGDFDFHQRFGEVLGVDFKLVRCRINASRLRISIDAEEVTAGGGAGKKWREAEFV